VSTFDSTILSTVFRRLPDIVPREIAGETLLVPVRGELAQMKQIFVLNPVAEHIWHNLDGSRSAESIVSDVVKDFEIDEETARSDLLEFLAELEEAGLIVSVADPAGPVK
jgi:hypothetical protein